MNKKIYLDQRELARLINVENQVENKKTRSSRPFVGLVTSE